MTPFNDWSYPFEDHGDASVDERWRRTLNREASQAGYPLAGVPERVQPPPMGLVDHVNDFYVPEHERREPIEDVDALLNDIHERGA